MVYLSRRNCDIVHCIYHPDGCAASILKKIKKLRYVYLVTTTPFKYHWKHSSLDFFMFKKAVAGSNRCYVPSTYAYECMQKEHNEKCEIIPCGVDLSRFKFNGPRDRSNAIIICTAALYDKRKRLPLLIKAFELLIKDGTKAILQLVAETNFEANRSLLSMIDDKAKPYIQILPNVTHKDLPELYSRASVSVLPSLSETFGMSLVESLACGTPVVGTRSGAIPEIICDDQVGTLFNGSNNSEASEDCRNLRDAIKKTLELASNPKTQKRCRDIASQYDWQKVVEKIEYLYKQAISG